MRRRLSRFFYFLGLLFLVTGAQLHALWPEHAVAAWLAAVLVFAVMIPWHFGYRSGRLRVGSWQLRTTAWVGNLMLGFWGTFVMSVPVQTWLVVESPMGMAMAKPWVRACGVDLGVAALFLLVGAAHGWRTCLAQDIPMASSYAGELLCRDGKFFTHAFFEGGAWVILYGIIRILFAAPWRLATGIGFGLFLALAGLTELRISGYREVQVEVAARAKEKVRLANEAKEMERTGVDTLLAGFEKENLPVAERIRRCEALANRALLFRCLNGLYPKLTTVDQCHTLTLQFDRSRCTEAVKGLLTARNAQ